MAMIKSIIPCLALVIILYLSISLCEGREFRVGGNKKKSWEIPSSQDEFNKWAEKCRFKIGDSIVLKYGKNDSVLQVSEKSYKACNTSNPINSYKDGNTKITLHRSGPFYFISGAQGHCHKGQKLEVVVLAANHRHSQAPSSVDNHHHAPAPAPAKSGGYGLRAGFWGGVVVMGVLALV